MYRNNDGVPELTGNVIDFDSFSRCCLASIDTRKLKN